MIKYIILFVCFLLQSTSANFVSVFGIVPNFILIGIILLVSRKDLFDGIRLGVFVGLLQDLLSFGYFGIGLFVKTLSGFSTSFFKKQIFSDNIISKMIIVVISVIINGISTVIFISAFYKKIDIYKDIITVTLPAAVYTSLILGAILLIKEKSLKISRKILKYYGIRAFTR